jgi:hypothetical protein
MIPGSCSFAECLDEERKKMENPCFCSRVIRSSGSRRKGKEVVT